MERGPIYIGGLDRCGKTTMRAFLVSHPHIAIPAVGSNMWTYFYGQYGDLGQRDNFERCLEAMLHYKHVRFLQPDPDRIRREFWQGPPTYARLFSLFLIHYAEREGKPRWGAQTGLIERYAPQLFAAYPGLKIIHMVRDPRDRYEASLALWPKGKGRVGGAVARWLYSLRLAERNMKRYPNDYKIVRFESLITQPEETLREVCAFLGETFTPDMLTMEGAPRHRAGLMKGSDIEPGQSPVSPEYIGGFRGKVAQREIAFMQLHGGRKMRAYGYALDPLPFSFKDWLLFAFVTWPNQMARLAAWQAVETIQQHFPGWLGRKPGRRMIVDEPVRPSNQPETT
jgi:hypothetical protein